MKDKSKLLPKAPGCYIMKDANGQVIYVGKAKNLANRVNSYFVGAHDVKTTHLVNHIADFETIVTANETEAFILEMNLIKEHLPKYNILMTDDKKYPYLCLTNQKYPRLIYTRDLDRAQGQYFGPYPDSNSARNVSRSLNKIFPFVKCRRIPKTPCLYYHIGQCLAPCINDIDPHQYDEYRTQVTKILTGKPNEVIPNLKKQMLEASEAHRYEIALDLRNVINDLSVISEQQRVEGFLGNIDAFSYATDEKHINIQLFHWRDGKLLERNGHLFDLTEDREDILAEFVIRFYQELNHPLPDEILVEAGNVDVFKQFIKTKITIPKRGHKRQLLNLVKHNAETQLEAKIAARQVAYNRTFGALHELENLLDVSPINRIEVFDNAHSGGEHLVSGMIVWEGDNFDRHSYRKYRIKSFSGVDDGRAMAEVISRRYRDATNLPDLIIVDGGVIQVNAVEAVLAELGITVPVLGAVKDERHETSHLFYRGNDMKISKRSYAFLLVKRLQDEVHRYVSRYFAQVQSKSLTASRLQEIPGVGPKTVQRVLKIVGEAEFERLLEEMRLPAHITEAILEIFSEEES